MKYELKNNNCSITISSLGAELISFKYKDEELLWNKKEFWNATSPILFPFIGALLNNKYIYEGKEYEFKNRHGFLRNQVLEVIDKTDDKITFELNYTKETLEMYPFKFKFNVIFTLLNNGINIQYIIKNIDDKEMYFSLGAHPGFILDDNYEEINYLEFSDKESSMTYDVDNGFCTKLIPFFEKLDNNKIIDIKDNYFFTNTIILKNLNSKFIWLKNRKKDLKIKLNIENFPFLAIWKKENAPFVCIEPWFGLPDFYNSNNLLEKKDGIIKLKDNDVFSTCLEITAN